MKTYYCVTSVIYDDGRITALITSERTTDSIPDNSYTGTSRRDIYNDWFESLEQAEAFVREAKEA